MNTVTDPPAPCSRCGAALPPDAPQGLCPRCLMALNLDTETLLTGERPQPAPAAPDLAHLAPHFPQLEILECLGRGGMGVVYKARQKTLNRMVALKLLAPERETDPAFAERFAREAQALAALSHPSIVTVHDFGQAGGYFYLLMEFVDGVNLRQAMQAGRFTPQQALAMVPPICEALQYAHERGVVHRDIKPENLLLDKEGRLKIADFGIARMIGTVAAADGTAGATDPQRHFTQTAGTPQYMAPEQAANPSQVDHRADIYSLGVVLYELLTGERPKDKIEPPSRRVQIDVRLDEVVLRALEKDPERRYATAAEFRSQVETIAQDGKSPDLPLPPRGLQKLLAQVLPRHWFEAVRLQSHDWHMVCPCGHEISVWNAGGLRFAAAGNPRRMMFCPSCHQFRVFTTVWRGPSASRPTASIPPAHASAGGPGGLTTMALGITVFYSLVVIGSLVLGSLPIAGAFVVSIPLGIGVPAALLFPIFWLNRWDWSTQAAVAARYLQAFGVLAWLLAVPIIGLGLFFLVSAAQSSGHWNPSPAEAFAVPMTWLGMLPLPWAGWRLWSAGRRLAGPTPPPATRTRWGCLIALAILLLFLIGLAFPAGLWLVTATRAQANAVRARERAALNEARAAERRAAEAGLRPPAR